MKLVFIAVVQHPDSLVSNTTPNNSNLVQQTLIKNDCKDIVLYRVCTVDKESHNGDFCVHKTSDI